MTLHIYNARLIDPASGLDATGGLTIEGETIAEVGPHLAAPTTNVQTLDAGGLCLAPGLIDLRVKTGEPGEEHRETLATASTFLHKKEQTNRSQISFDVSTYLGFNWNE